MTEISKEQRIEINAAHNKAMKEILKLDHVRAVNIETHDSEGGFLFSSMGDSEAVRALIGGKRRKPKD